ncbi:YDG/SRA domain-containing protein [Hymenobacter caeli]|uniref:Restriction endonuclease n=1 Tax=Hymenobacter caeli TaxID=2735894 RepID=A0ABX2FTM8_9BACT|nr:YDG/SRA domain-containing protein [Hymenobacter caeli]NRT20366.1 putative restriction endonuclease [Hymenobacter caeli]
MAKLPFVFGPIAGVAPGHEFRNRLELHGAGVHAQTQAGISARQGEGAASIVLSGGYEDDVDFGDVIIYTGRGGRSAESNRQVADQTLTGANLELVRNCTAGLPLRVTRKIEGRSGSFYRYDGLYRVASYWAELGKSGHRVWRFRLELLPAGLLTDGGPSVAESNSPNLFEAAEPVLAYGPAPRRASTVLRVVRDTAVSRRVKALHDYRCQVCGVQLRGAVPYAEAAHIRPLGAPHHGPDALANVLCLCANHHVLFDLGSFGINDNLQLLGLPGRLITQKKHVVGTDFLAYHRGHFYEPLADGKPS